MPDYTRITRRGLAQELGCTLGEENAWQCVVSACRDLGLEKWVLSRDEALGVLGVLRQQGGLVGITARALALRVAVRNDRNTKPLTSPGFPSVAASSSPLTIREQLTPAPTKRMSAPLGLRATETSPEENLTLKILAQMLGNSIGIMEAEALMEQASAELLIDANRDLTRLQAELVLEYLKRHPGLVGVSAHFLSTRLHMLTFR